MSRGRKPYRRALAAAIAMASMVGFGGTPVSPVSAPASIAQQSTKNALPRRISQSKRATKAGVMSPEIPLMGSASTGTDWIIRRTKNFRRKGVGSRWRHTMARGAR